MANKEFFSSLYTLLICQNHREKTELFETFYKNYRCYEKAHDSTVHLPAQPSYANTLKVVSPQEVPFRKNLHTSEGLACMLHSILHIEYSAIDLALDAAYRYRNMPDAFYDEWLEVADDEVRHFQMILEHLEALGFAYGDFEVHSGLFDAAYKAQTLHERMAVIPRFFEANGLDATPQILKKLEPIKHKPHISDIIQILHVILDEEVAHVKKGDRWFKYACDTGNIAYESYFEIIERYYPNAFPRQKHLNIDARKEAGFCCDELNRMSKKKVC